MSGFRMDDYVDVAQRIHEFYERFPDGSLRTGTAPHVMVIGEKPFVVYHAQAWRTAEDPCPADGWAWEPVPGPTQFTKDSELMNAETAAWGRAIVALGFSTKKIASAQEVRARQTNGQPDGSGDSTAARFQPPPGVTGDGNGFAASRADHVPPTDGGDPLLVRVHFGKNAEKTLGELTQKQREWYANTWEPNPDFANDADRRLKMAARILCGVTPTSDDTDEIPF